jgi:hypothetical protein
MMADHELCHTPLHGLKAPGTKIDPWFYVEVSVYFCWAS